MKKFEEAVICAIEATGLETTYDDIVFELESMGVEFTSLELDFALSSLRARGIIEDVPYENRIWLV